MLVIVEFKQSTHRGKRIEKAQEMKKKLENVRISAYRWNDQISMKEIVSI